MFQCPACEEWEHEENLEPDGRCWNCAEESPPPDRECIRCGYRTRPDDEGIICRDCFESEYAIGKQPAQCEGCGEWLPAKDLIDGEVCEDCAYRED